MISPEIMMLVVYFGSLLFLMVERCLQLLIECWADARHPKKDRTRPDCSDNWDWLIELENQPIEVTFDYETFLVYDRETELWHLEHREPEPSNDLIDLLLGDDAILIEATAMYNGYVRRKTGGFRIKSPSDF